MQHKIDEALDNITEQMLENVRNHINIRYQRCIDFNGGILEPHLK